MLCLDLHQPVNQPIAVFLCLRIIPCGNRVADVGDGAGDAIGKSGIQAGQIQYLMRPIQQRGHAGIQGGIGDGSFYLGVRGGQLRLALRDIVGTEPLTAGFEPLAVAFPALALHHGDIQDAVDVELRVNRHVTQASGRLGLRSSTTKSPSRTFCDAAGFSPW